MQMCKWCLSIINYPQTLVYDTLTSLHAHFPSIHNLYDLHDAISIIASGATGSSVVVDSKYNSAFVPIHIVTGQVDL